MDRKKMVSLLTMDNIQRMKTLIEQYKAIENKSELEKYFECLISKEIDLILKIFQEQDLKITLLELIKVNILSMFTEVQELYNEIININSQRLPDNESIIEAIFETIDLLHFVIQHFIFIELKRKGIDDNDVVDKMLLSDLFSDSESKNIFINLLTSKIVTIYEEVLLQMKKENDESYMLNMLQTLTNPHSQELHRITNFIITLNEFLKLTFKSNVLSFYELYIKMNFTLNNILTIWKFWKTYKQENYYINDAFNTMMKMYIYIYIVFMKLVSVLTNNINELKEQNSQNAINLFVEQLIKGNDLIINNMLYIYLFKHEENVNRQKNWLLLF